MRSLLVMLAIAVAGWHAYTQYSARGGEHALVSVANDGETLAADLRSGRSDRSVYECDGRTHCSQMTSCAEATWFLQHCPGTKMDGNNDGVPCERQWCR